MTRIYINKKEISLLPHDVHSLDQVIRLVECNHLSADTVIRQVQVNGAPLVRGEEDPDLPDDVHDRETIEIFTSALRDVALDSIREALTYLDRAETATHSLATGLRTQSDPEAFAELRQFYEGIYFTNVLLGRLEQSFHIPLEQVRVGSSNAREYCVKLASLLKAVLVSHEQKNFGRLADLLESEIGPLIPTGKEVFSSILAQVGGE